MKNTYAAAGVDIDAKDKAVKRISKLAGTTLRPEVLSSIGFFGGLFDFEGYKKPVLVSSVDGVGTKLRIAIALDRYDTVGIDIVNHCVNDIFTCGAEPLFFLDYIGIGQLVPDKVATVVEGLTQACREIGCSLIGGEIAEMPDIYSDNDYDLVGFITGVVEKDKIINGKTIAIGDTIIGLPSSGLHTNGYSLVRKIFGETRSDLETHYPDLGRTLGEELLEPHRCYYNQLKPLLQDIKGMAHITGGGLIGNVPRVLPPGTGAQFYQGKWQVPPIFEHIQRKGNIERGEMYRVFNMGIGMTVICSPNNSGRLTKALPESMIIGEVVEGKSKEKVIIR
ncbi:phosphoribosylformylglycinamidine cyclo-ligase [Chloroflexota bacterium]